MNPGLSAGVLISAARLETAQTRRLCRVLAGSAFSSPAALQAEAISSWKDCRTLWRTACSTDEQPTLGIHQRGTVATGVSGAKCRELRREMSRHAKCHAKHRRKTFGTAARIARQFRLDSLRPFLTRSF
jgi:hypothetical protein